MFEIGAINLNSGVRVRWEEEDGRSKKVLTSALFNMKKCLKFDEEERKEG